MSETAKDPYLIDGRLADVISLIQLLSFGRYTNRSEASINVDMHGAPESAECWTDIARAHREFFRIANTGDFKISLVARYAQYCTNPEQDLSLAPEDVSKLMELAVTMYDKAVERSKRWQVILPIVSAAASVLTLIAVLLTGQWLGS